MLKERCDVTEARFRKASSSVTSVTSHRFFNMGQTTGDDSVSPNLGTLPQEVAEQVVEVIRSWTNVEEDTSLYAARK